jgi:transposase
LRQRSLQKPHFSTSSCSVNIPYFYPYLQPFFSVSSMQTPNKQRSEYTNSTKEAIANMHKEGQSVRSISTTLKISKSGVHDVIARGHQRGSMCNVPRSGRPRILTKKALQQVQLALKRDEIQNPAQAQEFLRSRLQLTVSLTTIRRQLKAIGVTPHVQKKKPFISKAQRVKRLEAARECRDWSIDKWRTVVFTDETSISRVSTGKTRYVWLPQECAQAPPHAQAKGQIWGGRVSLWAAICPTGILAWKFF